MNILKTLTQEDIDGMPELKQTISCLNWGGEITKNNVTWACRHCAREILVFPDGVTDITAAEILTKFASLLEAGETK
jgi:hypothetical protein